MHIVCLNMSVKFRFLSCLVYPSMFRIVYCMRLADGLNLLEASMESGETMSNVEMIDCDSNIGLVSPVVEVPLSLLEQWLFAS